MPATIQLRGVSKLGEFFGQCCLFGTVVLLALGGCQLGEPDAAPADLPAECSYFGKNQTTKIPFTIENPRRVGDHYFESEDGGSHSNQRFEPTDREVYVYDVDFYE